MVVFVSSSFLLTFATLLLILRTAAPLILTVVNNCPFTIWPAVQPNAGSAVLQRGGFTLDSLSHCSFPAPDGQWSGRIWARTGCTYESNRFVCSTGDCGGRLECGGAGGAAPATLAQFSLHHGGADDISTYAVSLVDGFNLPMTVTPHEGRGTCPVVGCRANLLATCPSTLRACDPRGGGQVVGCKSGCEVFGTDELCCRNGYGGPDTCRPTGCSEFFKSACPATFTYAYDKPSVDQNCGSPMELKVIFCH